MGHPNSYYILIKLLTAASKHCSLGHNSRSTSNGAKEPASGSGLHARAFNGSCAVASYHCKEVNMQTGRIVCAQDSLIIMV